MIMIIIIIIIIIIIVIIIIGIIFLKLKALGPGQMINVWRPNTIKHCLVNKHFTVWTACLVLFDRVWSCLIKFEGHQTFDQNVKHFFCSRF